MPDSRHMYLFLISLLSAFLLLAPALVRAQCNVTNTNLSNFGATIAVTKSLAGMYACRSTMMNASFCFPGAVSQTTSILNATAMTTTNSPSCAWTCGCGPVIISGADGLPVELMEFSVDADAVQESQSVDGQAKD